MTREDRHQEGHAFSRRALLRGAVGGGMVFGDFGRFPTAEQVLDPEATNVSNRTCWEDRLPVAVPNRFRECQFVLGRDATANTCYTKCCRDFPVRSGPRTKINRGMRLRLAKYMQRTAVRCRTGSWYESNALQPFVVGQLGDQCRISISTGG